MLKIKDDVALKELEKFGFWKDSNFKSYHRGIYKDYLELFDKKEYLLILNTNKVIVKVKLSCILDFDENLVNGYITQTNRVNKYCKDLIKAGLVEKI